MQLERGQQAQLAGCSTPAFSFLAQQQRYILLFARRDIAAGRELSIPMHHKQGREDILQAVSFEVGFEVLFVISGDR